MKREIKFRGKRIDNGEWVFGFYNGGDYPVIYDETTIDGGAVDVNPETVAQFTGLKDKSGKEIYEGDILRDSEETYEVLFGEYELDYSIHTGFFTRHVTAGYIAPMDSTDALIVEVIGNIHRHPHLLTGDRADTGEK